MEEKNEEKMSRIKIGSFLIIIFMLVYVPSLIHWVQGEDITTDIIRIGEIEDSVNADGYIVRNEEVLESPFQGTCITEAAEGDKIGTNASVATVLKDNSESILESLKKKELEIIKAQQEKSKNTNIFSEDIAKLEKEIDEKVKLIVYEGSRNNLVKVGQIKGEIDELIQKKAVISGDTGSTDTYINSLKKEKENLELQMRANTRQIVSDSSGIISYVTDGYENVLQPATIEDITPKFLETVKDRTAVGFTGSMSVEAGKPFAKVIKDLDCYVVVALTEAKASRFKAGDSIRLRLNDINRIVSGSITYKSEKTEGKYIIAVQFDEGVSETSAMRKINVDLILKHFKGYRVPLSSLRDVDLKAMKAKIVLQKANCATIRDVKIKGTDGEFAIITNLDEKANNSIGLYDIYVCKPGNIQEGQMISE